MRDWMKEEDEENCMWMKKKKKKKCRKKRDEVELVLLFGIQGFVRITRENSI